MRLFLRDKSLPGLPKRVLPHQAPNRAELRFMLGLPNNRFVYNGFTYHVNDVFAETTVPEPIGGILLGGLLGLLGGPAGAAVGAVAGGVIFNSQYEEDKAKVDAFNNFQMQDWKPWR